jgi:hypothetical protein
MSGPPPLRLRPAGIGDQDARVRDISEACIATAERYPDGVRTAEVYIGGSLPGRGWNGWCIQETALANAERWPTWGEA